MWHLISRTNLTSYLAVEFVKLFEVDQKTRGIRKKRSDIWGFTPYRTFQPLLNARLKQK